MFGENVLIEWLAHRLRAHLVDDFGSFDEAADMGGENSIRAAFHTITSVRTGRTLLVRECELDAPRGLDCRLS
jgi:hypothetical protein